ncbi:MAG: hypothetical protein ABMA15_28760 [Vicinamibacterales bacterium]
MPLSLKTLLAAVVLLVCAVGAGISVRAFSAREASSVAQVASSAAAPQSDAVQMVQILEQQLAYTTAEVTQAELQRAVARADALVLSERLRAIQPSSGERVRELGEQLASTTAAVARLESQLAVSQGLVVELTERVRVARAFAGL